MIIIIFAPITFVQDSSTHIPIAYGSGHETEAVLLPGFAINW